VKRTSAFVTIGFLAGLAVGWEGADTEKSC
jgi:hypothetical protein